MKGQGMCNENIRADEKIFLMEDTSSPFVCGRIIIFF